MNFLILIFTPFLLSVIIYLAGASRAKYISLVWFSWLLYQSINLFKNVHDSGYLMLGSFLHVEKFDFILTLQVDMLSVIMLLLTSLLLILVTLSSWSVTKNANAYFALLTLFSGPIFGLFMSTNLLWFFIFWELTLIPIYFLIGIWGAERRVYAALKFFLYTHVASMLLLLGFFLIYQQSGHFDMTLVKESTLATPALIWWLLFIGVAVKMPIFPFHTWLPDAHVQAPAPISVLLAGVLLKMGAYALIRVLILMMPEASKEFAYAILIIGLISFFHAGFMALYETHLKKMVAYSSISHMGLVTIAIATLSYEGLSSALFEMIGHAFIISPLFLIAGYFHHKTQSWQMHDMGGIMQKAPFLSAIFMIAGLGALGFPATMGFVGEFTILISSITTFGVWLAIIAIGAIISASYMILSFRRVLFGEMSELVGNTDFSMNKIEFLALVIFAILILLFGIFPSALFDVINQAFAQGAQI